MGSRSDPATKHRPLALRHSKLPTLTHVGLCLKTSRTLYVQRKANLVNVFNPKIKKQNNMFTLLKSCNKVPFELSSTGFNYELRALGGMRVATNLKLLAHHHCARLASIGGLSDGCTCLYQPRIGAVPTIVFKK